MSQSLYLAFASVQGIDNGPLAGVLQVDIPKPALFDFAYDVFGLICWTRMAYCSIRHNRFDRRITLLYL